MIGRGQCPNEIVVTLGATEAINPCLQAVAKPGDTVAVESPTLNAMLHAIERTGMCAIEVATHPREGDTSGGPSRADELNRSPRIQINGPGACRRIG
jgi:DNA-binding transcriptional MocR family regulator